MKKILYTILFLFSMISSAQAWSLYLYDDYKGGIELEWWYDNPGEVVSYSVYRSTNSGSFEEIATGISGGGMGYYHDTSLSAGTNYCYYVVPILGSGPGTLSDTACKKMPCGPLGQPANPVAKAKSMTEIVITWEPSTGCVDGYRIYYSYSMNGFFSPLTSISASSDLKYTHPNLFPDTYYYYYIEAYNKDGDSYRSPVFYGLTLSEDPPEEPEVGVVDIKGEASIYMKDGNQLTLKNYEKEYPIPSDHSFILYSSSYVYLTIEAETKIPLKWIDVADELFIKVADDVEANIEISSVPAVDEPKAAISVGRLSIAGTTGKLNIQDVSTTNREYGLLISYSLTVDGEHTLNFSGSENGVRAGSYIKMMNGASLTTTGNSAGIYSASQVLLEKSASLNATASSVDGAGILLEGVDAGIYLFAGNGAADKITLNATSSAGYGIKIGANGNIIAKGRYVDSSSDWNTKLIATGVAGGIYLAGNGYVKADGAFIQGTRKGIDGNISAIHAPHSLYSLNRGEIEEVYNESNLHIPAFPYDIAKLNPAIGNNMKNVAAYKWKPTGQVQATPSGLVGVADASNVVVTAERSIINNTEYTKVDSISATNKSMHRVVLDKTSIAKDVTLTIYWIDYDYESDLMYNYNYDIERFLSENPNVWCATETQIVQLGEMVDPQPYLIPLLKPIPAECVASSSFNDVYSVYPGEPFEVTKNEKLLVFAYYRNWR